MTIVARAIRPCPHPATPPASRSSCGRRSIMPARSGPARRATSGSGSRRRSRASRFPRATSPSAATNCGRRPASRRSSRPRARPPIASLISRRRAIGRPMISPAAARAWPRPRSPTRPISGSRTISPGGALGATFALEAGRHWALGLSAVIEEAGRDQKLLGAGPRRRQARLPRPGLLHRAARLSQRR